MAPPSPGRNHPAALPQLTPRENVQGTHSAMGTFAPDKGFLCPPSHPHQSRPLRKGSEYRAPLDTERPETSANSSSEVDCAWSRGGNEIKPQRTRGQGTGRTKPARPLPAFRSLYPSDSAARGGIAHHSADRLSPSPKIRQRSSEVRYPQNLGAGTTIPKVPRGARSHNPKRSRA